MTYTNEQLRTMPLWNLVLLYGRNCFTAGVYGIVSSTKESKQVERILRERIEACGKGEGE